MRERITERLEAVHVEVSDMSGTLISLFAAVVYVACQIPQAACASSFSQTKTVNRKLTNKSFLLP